MPGVGGGTAGIKTISSTTFQGGATVYRLPAGRMPGARGGLSQRSDVLAELALQIGRFVLVDHVFLGQLVYHRDYLGEQLRSFGFVRTQTQFFDRVTGRFVVVTVAQTFFVVGTDTLDGRFVICHFY